MRRRQRKSYNLTWSQRMDMQVVRTLLSSITAPLLRRMGKEECCTAPTAPMTATAGYFLTKRLCINTFERSTNLHYHEKRVLRASAVVPQKILRLAIAALCLGLNALVRRAIYALNPMTLCNDIWLTVSHPQLLLNHSVINASASSRTKGGYLNICPHVSPDYRIWFS